MAHNSNEITLENYFNGLKSPYMGVDAVAMHDAMAKDGNMPHMVIDKDGRTHMLKGVEETGWTPHPDMPQPNFTVGLKLDDADQASKVQIDKLREVRDVMRETQALAEYYNADDAEMPQQGYIRLGRAFENAGQMRIALGQDTGEDMNDLPATYKMGLIRSEQAIRLSMARAQGAYDAALDKVAELQEHYETLKEKAGADIDTGWAHDIYNDMMRNLGTYTPVMTASTAASFAGIALGGATAITLNAAVDHGLAILDELKEMAVDLTDPAAMRDALGDAGKTAEDILDNADIEAVYGGIRGIATTFAPLKVMNSLPFQKYAGTVIERVAQPALASICSGASRLTEYVAKQLDPGTIRHAAAGLFGIEQAQTDQSEIELPRDSALKTLPQTGLRAIFYNKAGPAEEKSALGLTPPAAKDQVPDLVAP